MNEAVSATNVILNTAISPILWLIPSSLIILKNPIEGYNNKLKVSTENMFFGINNNLNYSGKKEEKEKSPVKKQHQIGVKKLETLGDKKKQYKKSPVKNPPMSSSENLIILSLSIVGGILISKYLL